MDEYQKTDRRKALTPLIAVLLALMCVAGVGIAYAIATLNSTQNVNENTIEEDYIKLKTDVNNTMAYDVLDEIAFNSTRTGETEYTFTVAGDEVIDTASAQYTDAMKISVDDWTVEVDQHLSTGYADTYDLVITVSEFTPVTGLTYIMKVGNTAVVFTSSAWTITGLSYDVSYDVALYVTGSITASASPDSGFENYSANPANTGSVFTFTAVAN